MKNLDPAFACPERRSVASSRTVSVRRSSSGKDSPSQRTPADSARAPAGNIARQSAGARSRPGRTRALIDRPTKPFGGRPHTRSASAFALRITLSSSIVTMASPTVSSTAS